MTMADGILKQRFEAAGQAHVFQYVDKLNEIEKEEFFKQLESIEIEKIGTLLDVARSEDSKPELGIKPYSGPMGFSSAGDMVENLRKTGLDAIAKGQVAALVLAGGQGTRLGFSGPKGMYDIGLPSKSSLFKLMAERIKKLQSLASSSQAVIPFYIMTSPLNHDETVEYFESNECFGLKREDVFFFKQGMLPCLTEEGKIIMESPSKVAMAPDGNGGIYPSLLSSKALDDLEARGILYLHAISIDNALVKPADPVFMGYCISTNADCGNKVVWKAHAHEKVGVIATKANKPCIVEYSEITKEMAESVDTSTGRLKFGAGNICNHFYTVDFIRNAILPNMGNLYHIAHKKIPAYDPTKNETITPPDNNGIKLETFIFDVLPLSKRMAIFEVNRAEEFSPVKNKPGSDSDSPDTARRMISELAKAWVKTAGAKLMNENSQEICEISPSTSYAGEGMKELVGGKKVECPFRL